MEKEQSYVLGITKVDMEGCAEYLLPSTLTTALQKALLAAGM